jgi:hypothetical protein
MRATTAVTTWAKGRTRHFDRGFRFAAPALAFLIACSGSPNTSNDPATGSAGSGGGAGTVGSGGGAGTIGSGGGAGTVGSECAASSGAGNCVTGGTGGGSGTTGAGGSGGAAPLPACTATGPTFGVCFTSDAESSTGATTLNTSGAATIEAVGAGASPGLCTGAHVIGMRDSSQWWLRARAADNHRWTIGALGLAAPAVQVGDTVSLDLDWREGFAVPGVVTGSGKLQLSDSAGTPLLWAGADASPSTWISFSEGSAACADSCVLNQRVQRNVIATVNGSSMTLAPYGAASLGGYRVQVTWFAGLCGDYARPFEAAAVRIATSPTPPN